MPKPNEDLMTFEEFMEDEAQHTKWNPGDTPESLLKLGNQVLKEEATGLRRLTKKRKRKRVPAKAFEEKYKHRG